MFDTPLELLILANAADNSDAISMAETKGGEFNVTLANRTLYKDGDWNTLCLPFNLTIAGSPLDGDGVEVRTLSEAGFSDGTLTLTFTPATGEGAVTELVAGTPYIVKWNNTEENLTETDLVFTGVTIDATARNRECDLGDGKSITFTGTYSPVNIYTAENTNLYLGTGNKIYYPTREGYSVKACRAYFQLNGLTAGDPTNGVRAFKLNFGEGETTGIVEMRNEELEMRNWNEEMRNGSAWYSLDGRKINDKPLRRGIYIKNGRKIVNK